MVRLIQPGENMRVYDPTVGSGGMLIQSRQFVEEHGGNPDTVSLFGQDANGGSWAMAKMNLIMHGIMDADLRNEDTLAKPLHREPDGSLMRFERVIANPPFSLNYSQKDLEIPGRFPYGFTPEGGKKADLMFLQHMLSVTRSGGMVATVMPHGVLFRGGEERTIRQRLLEDDALEAVIGLPANLFYGTGIPAAILILRPKGGKQEGGRTRCCSSTPMPSTTPDVPRTTCGPNTSRRLPAPTRHSTTCPVTPAWWTWPSCRPTTTT